VTFSRYLLFGLDAVWYELVGLWNPASEARLESVESRNDAWQLTTCAFDLAVFGLAIAGIAIAGIAIRRRDSGPECEASRGRLP
jgi:hypothetical protein